MAAGRATMNMDEVLESVFDDDGEIMFPGSDESMLEEMANELQEVSTLQKEQVKSIELLNTENKEEAIKWVHIYSLHTLQLPKAKRL